ncbi:hypothetical protein HDV63DRAFT_364741 [Trichoderma sp. SZMC 28014]
MLDFPTSKLTPKIGQSHAPRKQYECGGCTNSILTNSILSSTERRWMSDGRLSRDCLMASASLCACISNDAPPHGSPCMPPIRDLHHGIEETESTACSYSIAVGSMQLCYTNQCAETHDELAANFECSLVPTSAHACSFMVAIGLSMLPSTVKLLSS